MSEAVALLAAAKRRWEEANLQEAERLWRAVLAADPFNAHAAAALGAVLLDSFRFQEAHELVMPVAQRRPFDSDLRVLMGRFFHAIGQIPAAREAFEGLVRSNPKSVPGRVGLALCALASQRTPDAMAMLQPLVAQNPGDAFVHAAMGQVKYNMGIGAEAVGHYRAALARRPSPAWRVELGWALLMARQLDEARAEFDAVLSVDDTVGAAIAGKAQVLIDQGAADQARVILSAALEAGSLDGAVVTTHARLAKTPEHRAEARRHLQRRLALTQGKAARSSALMAMGALEEADGKFDAAFACYRDANDTGGEGMSAERLRGMFDQIVGVYSPENMERLPRNPRRDALPVFIVGMPRSGTSLVEQILASHPAVYGGGELDDMHQIAAALPRIMSPASGLAYPECVQFLGPQDVERAADEYLTRMRARSGAARIATDKMPWNFVFCGLIDLMFPGARIIHCLRDPLDTCFSIFATPLGEAHSYRNRLGDLAATYRGYRKVMDYWKTVVRVPMLDVRYEDVVGDVEAHAKRIVEFVGLPWDERCLKFYQTRRSVGTASMEQVRRPIYDTSIGRGRRFEASLGELVEGLKGLE